MSGQTLSTVLPTPIQRAVWFEKTESQTFNRKLPPRRIVIYIIYRFSFNNLNVRECD